MPKISYFYGISIYFYFNDNRRRHKAHFHARYSGYEASFDFEGQLIDGTMPKRAKKLIREWVFLHKNDLRKSWEFVIKGENPPCITPLP